MNPRSARRLGLLVLVVCGLLGPALGVWTAARRPTSYRATATVLVSLDRAPSVDALGLGSTYVQGLVPSFAALAVTSRVLDPVATAHAVPGGGAALAARTSIGVSSSGVLLDISVHDRSATTAAALADGLATELQGAVAALAPRSVHGTVIATPLGHASVEPRTPERTRVAAMAGTGLGLLCGAGVRRVLLRRARRRFSRRELRGFAFRVLGVLGEDEPTAAAGLWTAVGLVLGVDRPRAGTLGRCVVVTAPGARGGTSATTTALARAAAAEGRRVLIVDACPRPGTVGIAGLTQVLAGRTSWRDCVVTATGYPDRLGPGVLPAGVRLELGTRRTARLLREWRADYDLVVIDAPPVLLRNDAAELGRRSDGVVLVVDPARHGRLASTAADELTGAGAHVLGLSLHEHALGSAVAASAGPVRR